MKSTSFLLLFPLLFLLLLLLFLALLCQLFKVGHYFFIGHDAKLDKQMRVLSCLHHSYKFTSS